MPRPAARPSLHPAAALAGAVAGLGALGFGGHWLIAAGPAPGLTSGPAAPSGALSPELPEPASPTPAPRQPEGSAAGAAAHTADAGAQPPREDPALAWNEEGCQLLEAADHEGAIARFEAALLLEPDVDVYANNLAEALFRRAKARFEGEPAEALALLERALATLRDDGRRAELTPLRDRWRRAQEAEDGFWTTSSPYFAVSFDGTRRELMNNVHEVIADLDTYYGEFGELFGQRPVDEGRAKIRVVFYHRAEFGAVTGLGDWAGGVFDGTIRVPVESLTDERDRLRAVLRHELMHAFIHYVSGGQAPAWLNEGLAQWIERPGEGRTLDVALARGRLRGHELFPLESLRGTLAAWQDQQAIGRAYAQALLVVDHLAYSKGERLVFELVAASKSGGVSGPEQHFLERFPGFPLQEFVATVPR